MTSTPIMTVQQHILEEQRRLRPEASGEFSWLLSGITLATKIIADQVRRAGLVDILGSAGGTNVQGEIVQKLDVIANHALLQCLGKRGNVAVMASEENDEPVVVPRDREHGRYVVVFDPLDGSSNIDVNVSVGTIFSILRREPEPDRYSRRRSSDVLQPGRKQVAAGYVVYGSSTMLVYTTGNGVHGFTLDPAIGAYLISHPNITMPRARLDLFRQRGQRRQLSGALSPLPGAPAFRSDGPALFVALHRLAGGRLPSHAAQGRHLPLSADRSRIPTGKLRLMYEANPIAFLAEQAGGMATDGSQRILDKKPQSLHQRTPLLVGSRTEMDLLHRFLKSEPEA